MSLGSDVGWLTVGRGSGACNALVNCSVILIHT